MKSQNSGISCMDKGLFQKSLLQKGFLTPNRAQKGKRAIRPRPDFHVSHVDLGYIILNRQLDHQIL